MNSLTLLLKAQHAGRMDLTGIVPDRILPLTLAEIRKLDIVVDGHVCLVSEHFEAIEGQRDKLIVSGDLARADNVGGAMRDGLLIIEGSIGHCLAANMRGGQIVVRGNAGDYACNRQRGGYVSIEGNVGETCGGALPGERRGMRGGVLRVAGAAGRFLGYRMRRGTIVVAGDIGQGCASSLVAGTIVCSGQIAAPVGVSMRRGTIIALTAVAPPLHVGFTPPEPIRLSYLYLLLDGLRPQLPDVQIEAIAHQTMWRSLGDRASGGTGEILWLAEG